MENKKIKLAVLLTCVISVAVIQAQEAVLSTGGEASGSGGSVSYSVGQMAYITHTGTNGSVSEGVQQAYEISHVSSIEEANEIELVTSVYPNPTSDCITLKVKDYDIYNLSYQLYNINGELVKSQSVYSKNTIVDMNQLTPSNYFLRLIQNNIEVKTFKIIKNQ
jgi:hypothetical protein